MFVVHRACFLSAVFPGTGDLRSSHRGWRGENMGFEALVYARLI